MRNLGKLVLSQVLHKYERKYGCPRNQEMSSLGWDYQLCWITGSTKQCKRLYFRQLILMKQYSVKIRWQISQNIRKSFKNGANVPQEYKTILQLVLSQMVWSLVKDARCKNTSSYCLYNVTTLLSL